MPPGRTPIPLCRSSFLQDLTIELGLRSLKSVRQSYPTLTFRVWNEEVDEESYERLDIEAISVLGWMIKIAIWEDGTAWVYSKKEGSKKSRRPTFETHANLEGMNARDIAQLIRDSLTDMDRVENFWKQRTSNS